MKDFKEISPYEVENAMKLIGKTWMLITANDEENGRANAMTASWGTLGVLWNKCVCTAFIRPQRHTYSLVVRIVLPAAIIVTGIYIFMGASVDTVPETEPIDWIKLIPYILVIAFALSGVNVSVVLATGLAVNALIGFSTGCFGWSGFLESVGKGISGMGDLIIVTMLAGGMLELIRVNGGLDFIVNGLTRKINGKRGAELSIAGLVALANLCTANNTIAIITTGRIAKDITDRYGLDPRKTASILDTFSCLVQGLIPYGAQLLMAGGLAGISMISIIQHLYYPFIMGICAIMAILLRFPRKYS